MVKGYETWEIETIVGVEKDIFTWYLPMHTPECHAQQARDHDARLLFYLLFPDACKYCDATGIGHEFYDSHTGGLDIELCDDCLEWGKCPTCGITDVDAMEETGYESCSYCKWNYHDHINAPDPYACDGCGKGATRLYSF